MIRSFILAASVVVTALMTGCGSMPNVQARVPVSIDGARGHISISTNQQLAPVVQIQSYDSVAVQQIPNTQTGYASESPPCRIGTHQTGWQGARRVCAPGSTVQQQNNVQQQGGQQQALPCRTGTHQTGWQGTRRVCAPDNGQQQGGNYQQSQQQYQAPKPVGYAPANNLFAGCAPGQYNYNGACYAGQQTQAPSIAGSACRTVNTVYGPRQQC